MEPNVPVVENTQEIQPKPKSKLPLILIIALVVILALGGASYAAREMLFKSQPPVTNTAQNSPTITPEAKAQLSPLPTTQFTAPKQYVFTNSNGDLGLGNLATGVEKILYQKTYKYSFLTSITEGGKYVSYFKLPDTIAQEFEKNPPYEFYGSDKYELHIVDISNPSAPQDKLAVQNVYSGMGEFTPHWNQDDTELYYSKYEGNDYSYYSYTPSSGNIQKVDEAKVKDLNATFSSSRQYFVRLDKSASQDPTSSVVNARYDLNLYNKDATLKKTIYKNIETAEFHLLFPDDNTVYLAREEYFGTQGHSTCYIEQYAVNSGVMSQIEKKDCPPGQSNTSYSTLKTTPDGKKLVALYSENSPGLNDYRGHVWTYDFATGEKKILGDQKLWYNNYYFTSPTEIIATVPGFRAYSNPIQNYTINLTTGTVTPNPTLSGKDIISIF